MNSVLANRIPVKDQKIKKNCGNLTFPLCIVDCLIFYVVLAVFTDGYISH